MIIIECKSKLDEQLLIAELKRRSTITSLEESSDMFWDYDSDDDMCGIQVVVSKSGIPKELYITFQDTHDGPHDANKFKSLFDKYSEWIDEKLHDELSFSLDNFKPVGKPKLNASSKYISQKFKV